MFSWQSSFFFQYAVDNFEKGNDKEKEKIINALVSYKSPDIFIRFILAKGNPSMLSHNFAQSLFSMLVDYCMAVDYEINYIILVQIIDFLIKVLSIKQTPKLFQKIMPFFYVVFGTNYTESEKLYKSLKNISILPLTFFAISYRKHINDIFSVLINSSDFYLNSNNIRLWIISMSALFKSGVKFDYDLLAIYSLCDKISDIENYDIPLYFRSEFFDSLTYFLSPMNSFQIAKDHFVKISGQISKLCTAHDLVSFLLYSKHLVSIRKVHNVQAFTINMIIEIVFSSILPRFRKSDKLQTAFTEFTNELTDKNALQQFVNTHFTTSSLSAKQFLVSNFPTNEQNIDVLFTEPIDHEIIHHYVTHLQISENFLVHFFDFSKVDDFPHLLDSWLKKSSVDKEKGIEILCQKIIQYLPICDNQEKMNYLLSYLFENCAENGNLPFVSLEEIDLAFLVVTLQIIQYPNNQNNKFFYSFLKYLKDCKEYFSEDNEIVISSKDLNENIEETPRKTPKSSRRLSNEKLTPSEKPIRRLSDAKETESTPNKQICKALIRHSSREIFTTPRKSKQRGKKNEFAGENKKQTPIYILHLINSIDHWNETLLSHLYAKLEEGKLHFGILVGFFTETKSIINQIGKMISHNATLLKLFFTMTLSVNSKFISEIMKYLFFMKDLIEFRIELVLHCLSAVYSFNTIDDTVFEIFKLGFSNQKIDLTLSAVANLFNISSSIEFEIDDLIKLICENDNKCDALIFQNSLLSVLQNYDKIHEISIQRISHSWINVVTHLSDSIFESVFLEDQRTHITVVEELRLKHPQSLSSSVNYFKCIKRISLILSFDEMKPIFSRLILSFRSNHKEIRSIIQDTLTVLFNDDFSSKSEFSPKLTESTVSYITQSLFNTINFQSESEKKSLFRCLKRFVEYHPKAIINAQPPIIPQFISTFSDVSFTAQYKKYESTISKLTKADIVVFYSQLTLSPKCSFYDRIILNVCQYPDEDSQLFACIENEFLELRFHSINFSFNFNMLSMYIQYHMEDKNMIDSKIASLLLILFLCISESFISNEPKILNMLVEPFKQIEVILSIPLLPNSVESIENIFDLIPFPLFSNEVINLFLSKIENLIMTKHKQNYLILISSLLISFYPNTQIFSRLINIYVKEKENPNINFIKVSRIFNNKLLLKSIKGYINDIFDISLKHKCIDVALNCALIINQDSFYQILLSTINHSCLPKSYSVLSSRKFYKCFQNAKRLKVINEEINKNIIFLVQNELFNESEFAYKILSQCFENSNAINVIESLFFYHLQNSTIENYIKFAESSLEKFEAIKNISKRELEIMFNIINNLIGIETCEILVSRYFDGIIHHSASKEAKYLAKNLNDQYSNKNIDISFPIARIRPKDEMFHV